MSVVLETYGVLETVIRWWELRMNSDWWYLLHKHIRGIKMTWLQIQLEAFWKMSSLSQTAGNYKNDDADMCRWQWARVSRWRWRSVATSLETCAGIVRPSALLEHSSHPSVHAVSPPISIIILALNRGYLLIKLSCWTLKILPRPKQLNL